MCNKFNKNKKKIYLKKYKKFEMRSNLLLFTFPLNDSIIKNIIEKHFLMFFAIITNDKAILNIFNFFVKIRNTKI